MQHQYITAKNLHGTRVELLQGNPTALGTPSTYSGEMVIDATTNSLYISDVTDLGNENYTVIWNQFFPTSQSNSSVITMQASETISIGNALTGDMYKADSSNVSHIGKIIGVALGNGITGADIPILLSGEVSYSSFSFSEAGKPIYLNGTVLSEIPPITGFLQVIGVSVGTHNLVMGITPPILL